MKIQMGLPMMGNVTTLEANSVRFVTEEGRTAFEVSISNGGTHIEIRAVDCCRFDDVLHSERLRITPVVSNSVKISTVPYDEEC